MTDRTTLVIPTDRFMAAVATFSSVASPATHAKQAMDNKMSNTPPRTVTMEDNAAVFRVQEQQQQQQQPNTPEQSPALSPQPSHIDRPQNPLPGNPPVMPQPTPPETTPHPSL